MSDVNFYELKCQRCGGRLIKSGDMYTCESCGKAYEKQSVTDFSAQLDSALDSQKQEQIANLRQLLWKETHEEYISNKEVERLCKEILKYLPEDFYANFYLATCSKSKAALGVFLNAVDVDKNYNDIPDVLDYILKALKPEWTMATGNFIERAYKNNDLKLYHKYRTVFEEENQKIEDCVFDPAFPRDVFIAYSSQDMPEVERLADELDKAGLTCFVAARNLRHGSGAVENYEKAIQTAIEHCQVIVFVSSDNSRNIKCDAYKELGFVERAFSAKPRVEYLVKNYSNKATERFFKEFFNGLEYTVSAEDAAKRVCAIIMNGAQPDAPVAQPAAVKVPEETAAAEAPMDDNAAKVAKKAVKAAQKTAKKADKPKDLTAEAVTRDTFSDGKNVDSSEKKDDTPEETVKEAPITLASFTDKSKKICRKCGATVNTNIKHCTSCGNGTFFNNYEEYRLSTLPYCANCGRANEENYNCCPDCGSNNFISYEEHIKKVEEQKAEKKRLREAEEERRRQEQAAAELERHKKKKEQKEKRRRLYKLIKEGIVENIGWAIIIAWGLISAVGLILSIIFYINTHNIYALGGIVGSSVALAYDIFIIIGYFLCDDACEEIVEIVDIIIAVAALIALITLMCISQATVICALFIAAVITVSALIEFISLYLLMNEYEEETFPFPAHLISVVLGILGIVAALLVIGLRYGF